MNRLAFRIALFITLSLVFQILPSPAQEMQQEKQKTEDEPVKLRTTLVQVPVIVKDEGERYLTNLKKEDFKLYENGRLQEITFFGTTEIPFNVALLIDSSGSTTEQLSQIKASALAFVENLRPADKVMIVEFNDSVGILCELTNNKETLRSAISRIQPGEYTQVYEAVYTAIWERLHDIEGRKAVILFSDGIDNASSEIDEEDTLAAIAESEDVLVYPIRYSTRPDVERKLERRYSNPAASLSKTAPASLEEARRELDKTYRQADQYLFELARLSGGVVERADELTDLQAAFARIADELRKQYLLGYYPPDDKSDEDRRIQVRVSRPGAKVRARPGYKPAEQR